MRGAHSRRRRRLRHFFPQSPLTPLIALVTAMLVVTGLAPSAWRSVQKDLRHPNPAPVSFDRSAESPGLRLTVVPALPDFLFRVNGRMVATDNTGTARLDGARGQIHVDAVGVSGPPSMQLVRTRRWGDGTSEMRRTVDVRGVTTLALGVDISRQVTASVDAPVGVSPPNVVVRFASAAGTTQLVPGRSTLVLAQRAVRRGSRLTAQNLVYAVRSATSDGYPVRVQNQQLDPSAASSWAVHLA